jgi:hypothetical protein
MSDIVSAAFFVKERDGGIFDVEASTFEGGLPGGGHEQSTALTCGGSGGGDIFGECRTFDGLAEDGEGVSLHRVINGIERIGKGAKRFFKKGFTPTVFKEEFSGDVNSPSPPLLGVRGDTILDEDPLHLDIDAFADEQSASAVRSGRFVGGIAVGEGEVCEPDFEVVTGERQDPPLVPTVDGRTRGIIFSLSGSPSIGVERQVLVAFEVIRDVGAGIVSAVDGGAEEAAFEVDRLRDKEGFVSAGFVVTVYGEEDAVTVISKEGGFVQGDGIVPRKAPKLVRRHRQRSL